MSDPNIITQRQIQALQDGHERLRKADVGTASGTTFPTSPTTSFVFFRTDLGWACYYDGTRWLTTFTTPISLLPNRSTVAANTIWDTKVRNDYAVYVEYIALASSVAATNNGTNFWTITIQGVNLA